MPNMSIVVPNTVRNGDLLRTFVASFQGDSTGSTPPTGWALLNSPLYGPTIQLNSLTADVWSKAGATTDRNTNLVWGVTGTGPVGGLCLDVGGSTGEEDYKAFGLGAAAAFATPGAFGSTPAQITTVGQLITVAGLIDGNFALTPPAGWTLQQQAFHANLSVFLATQVAAAVGPVTGFTVDFGGPKFDCVSVIIVWQGAGSLLRGSSLG